MTEPLAELDSSPEPRRRKRPVVGLILVTVNFAILVAALVAALVVTTRFVGPARLQFDFEGDAVTLPDFGDRGAHVVNYHHGETVTFSFVLRNRGLLSARIDGVRLSKEQLTMLSITSVSVNGLGLPATVGAGEDATVLVTGRFGNCRYYHEREVELIDTLTVDASVLGLGVTRRVALDHDLVVRSPMIVGCPDRTLVRGDDTRPRG